MLIPIADLKVKKFAPPRPEGAENAEPCLLCGRWILGSSKVVEITTDGCVVFPGDGTCGSVPNSQGGFPVGIECWRKIARAAKSKLVAEAQERIARARELAKKIVAAGKCPVCETPLRRNLALSGWWQCGAYGGPQFRALEHRDLPHCSFQCFTE